MLLLFYVQRGFHLNLSYLSIIKANVKSVPIKMRPTFFTLFLWPLYWWSPQILLADFLFTFWPISNCFLFHLLKNEKYLWKKLVKTGFVVWSDASIKIKREKEILDFWYYDGDENMVGKVFIHFPLYLVWPYDLFWFWTLPTKFCVTAQ